MKHRVVPRRRPSGEDGRFKAYWLLTMVFDAPGRSLSFEQYQQAADTLHALTGMLLFEFARHSETATNRDLIGRNFIARADTMVKGILRLWEISDYADCWILNRALLDRLFHLHSLHKQDQFDAFEAWSFRQQYEAAGRLRSDPDLKEHVGDLIEELSPEQKLRYKSLIHNPPNWRRPKAEDTAKEMDLNFLYRYGYDFASRSVHPMANDGQQDFYNITRVEPTASFAEPTSAAVLSNSILIASMIMQEALNASTLSWRRIVYDAVDGIRKFLVDASPEHHLAVAKLGMIFNENGPLSHETGEI